MKKATMYGFALLLLLCACGNVTNNAKNSEEVQTEQRTEVDEKKSEGTEFFNISLEEALAKAKSEGKLVLIDCHAKSCGPCRKMEKTVFPQAKCGEFINSRFVPIMMDMEEGDGMAVAEKYEVGIYPTFLVLSPDGKKQGEIVGAEFNIDDYISMLNNILNKE